MRVKKREDYFGNKIYVRSEIDEYVLKEIKYYNKKITLDKNDHWLDIGTHIGSFALSIYKDVKMIFCFEPEKENYVLLKKNVELNKIKNIKTHNMAVVGNDDDERSFFINTKKNTGGHSFYIKRGRQELKTKCININNILKTYKINKIKMDCEGAEYEIIKNIDQELLNGIEELIFEYHFNVLKDHPEHEKYFEIIEILKKNFSEVEYLENVKKHWHTIVYAKR